LCILLVCSFFKESSNCKIEGSHSSVDEESSLPGCDSMSLTLKLKSFKQHHKTHIQPNAASHPKRCTPLMFPHSSVHFFSTAPINNIIQNITCASKVGQLVKVYCGQHFIVDGILLWKAFYCVWHFIVDGILLCMAFYCGQHFIVYSILLWTAFYCGQHFILNNHSSSTIS